jgi:endonuclease/exonuclease/phosphatase (EEP) superfamily protein YafD
VKNIFVLMIVTLIANVSFARAPLSKFGALEAKYDYLPFNFKVVNWNIYKGGKDGMAQDFAALGANADVVLFQEALDSTELVRNIVTANQELVWHMVRAFENDGVFTGVATGSRVKALRIEGFHSVVREPVLNTPKTMLVSEYAISNSQQTLLILNIHAINFVLNSQYKKQIQQLVDIVKNHVGPLLIAGDFNTWNSGRKQFLDNSLHAIGAVQLSLKNQQSLDHVYVRNLSATTAEVVEGVNSSDHKPIVLQLYSEARSLELTAN